MSAFHFFRPAIEQKLQSDPGIPLSQIRLRAPAPRPGKIMCMSANYMENTAGGTPIPIQGFLVPPEGINDPGGTAILPDYDFNICHHEAELVAIIGRQGRHVSEAEAYSYVFGYTAGIDVSARGSYNGNTRLGKSYDGFKPIGPCIVTADDIPNPHDLRVRLSVDGQLRQDYNTSDMAYKIPECLAYWSSITSLMPGDILFVGTNHQGLGPLQDGETANMGIDGIGNFDLHIVDPLKRKWEKNVDPNAGTGVRQSILEGTGRRGIGQPG